MPGKLKKYWYVPVGAISLLLLSSKSVRGVVAKTIDIKEIGNDAGFSNKSFEAELKKLDWQPGWAWCVMYTKYVWSKWLKGKRKEAAMKLFSANSQITWNNFKNDKSGYFEVSKTPKVGSIAIWQGYYNKATGHAGIVTKVEPGYFETIEGNYGNKVEDGIKRKYNYYTPTPAPENLVLIGFINVR
ncbi:MAG: CHAP domain-containing protein [Bacteroidales bacterium]|nr:CHAP domain-containing protein [Bacteroidales bacterium]